MIQYILGNIVACEGFIAALLSLQLISGDKDNAGGYYLMSFICILAGLYGVVLA